MKTMNAQEFFERTGITMGYGEEILKNTKHAAWHIPSGAAFADETDEESDVDDPVVEEPVEAPVEAPVEDPVEDPVDDETSESDEEGGSVEGE